MTKEIKKIKVITFPALFVRSLAKDFETKDITWAELYSMLFIKGTDIYREMRVTLAFFGLKMKDKVSYEKTFLATETTQVIFELETEESGKRILTHGKTKEQTIVPKSVTTATALSKLGFTQKIFK